MDMALRDRLWHLEVRYHWHKSTLIKLPWMKEMVTYTPKYDAVQQLSLTHYQNYL